MLGCDAGHAFPLPLSSRLAHIKGYLALKEKTPTPQDPHGALGMVPL